MLSRLLSTRFCGKAQIFVLKYLKNMLIHNLKNVGGPLLWEALGHGLLGLGLKRALPTLYVTINWPTFISIKFSVLKINRKVSLKY